MPFKQYKIWHIIRTIYASKGRSEKGVHTIVKKIFFRNYRHTIWSSQHCLTVLCYWCSSGPRTVPGIYSMSIPVHSTVISKTQLQPIECILKYHLPNADRFH